MGFDGVQQGGSYSAQGFINGFPAACQKIQSNQLHLHEVYTLTSFQEESQTLLLYCFYVYHIVLVVLVITNEGRGYFAVKKLHLIKA